MLATRMKMAASNTGDNFYALKVLSYSPIAYWRLNESSGIVATDSSGNGYNGTYANVSVGASTFEDGAACPTFDGSSSYVDIYSAGFDTAWDKDEYTLMCWFKHSGTWNDGNNRDAIYMAVDSSNRVYIRKSSVAAGQARVTADRNGTEFQRGISTTSNDWLFYAQTVSVLADAFKAYQDGVNFGGTLSSLTAWVGALSSATTLIGARSQAGTGVFNGQIAHIAILPLLNAAAILDLNTTS